ncbi:MAG: hypothetical protein U1F10_17750 [Burkholderiales bacterium]
MLANSLRLLAAAVTALMLAVAPPALATTSVDYGDQWAAPGETGWGLNLAQQADVLFATLFVYGAGEQAVWYSATLTYQATIAGAARYAGTLYQTSGSPLGKPYDPALLRYREVGLMTIDFGDDAHGALTYTVDGAGAINQPIARLTFAPQGVAGTYIGASSDITFGCANPALDNRLTTDAGPFTITQTGSSIVIQAPTCRYTGTYTQQGQVGRAVGEYTCTNGAYGFITFTALRAQKAGMTGNYTGSDPYCEFRGNIGGMRELK